MVINLVNSKSKITYCTYCEPIVPANLDFANRSLSLEVAHMGIEIFQLSSSCFQGQYIAYALGTVVSEAVNTLT